ncbi:CdaR family protein [Virgibacillus flavescens]|uniref:CdaR family protein n=1 Tax=Virgibacillus flavescens TaxID=1611422 RepID=UPI003D359808
MDKWFKSKWFVRIISLAFAVLLYVFVSLDVNDNQSESQSRLPGNDGDDIETIENYPLGLQINEDKYVVSGVPETVTVQLQGNQGVLVPAVRQQGFKVTADLEGLGAGEHTIELESSNVPNNLDVYIEPKEIDVVIEEKASEEFSVNIDFINTNKLPDGYEIGSSEVEPKTVTIISSKEMIDRIAIVKVFVDVANLEQSIDSREVPVNVYDSQGNQLDVSIIEPKTVVVSAELLNPSKTVPVEVQTSGELPEDYTLSSISSTVEELKVFATNDVLDSIEQVSTEEINLSDITESQTIKAKLALPDGARVPSTETIEVKVELERKRTIKDITVDVENLNDGQEVSFIEPDDATMSVTVAGSEKDISDLTAEDIQLTADVEGLEEGEHQVPIIIQGPENVQVVPEVKEVTIEIT